MAWTRFFRRRRWDEERSRELESYLDIETEERIARGTPPKEARLEARKKLGNPTSIREEIYRMNTASFLEALWRDLRHAFRQLARSPGFTAAAVLSLALGIGANTAIFSLLDQVLLRLLPVHAPQRLVLLKWQGEFYGPGVSNDVLSYPLYQDIRDRNQAFAGVLAYNDMTFGAGYQGPAERITGELVSGNFFEVLGVPAALGRTFSADDDRIPGGHPVAVLSYDFWVDRFHSDREMAGRSIAVNGTPFTVVGVAAPGFTGLEVGSPAKIFLPMMMRNQVTAESFAKMFGLESRRGRWVRVLGRLKPGMTIAQAKASLQPLFHSILEMEVRQAEFSTSTPEIRKEFLRSWLDVQPASRGHSDAREQYQGALSVLVAMVGLVLLIACANVANLLLARAAGRRREIAVRLALGASRGCIVRQSLVESLLLALMGGAAGLLGAMWSDQVLLRLLAAGDAPLGLESTPDLRILIFTLTVSIVTGVLFGLAPVLGATRVDLAPKLREGSRAVSGGSASLRRTLVVAQVFVSALLLIGAGLFVRSLRNLRKLDPGFGTGNVVAFSIDPSLLGYSAPQRQQVFRHVLERLRAISGVDSASLGVMRVIDDAYWCDDLTVDNDRSKSAKNIRPCHNAVSPGYLATLGIPLMAGRDFSPADAGNNQLVALVNQTFATQYFGNQPAVGHHFGFGVYPGTKTDIQIVGVIKDAKYESMREATPPQTIVDYEQMKGVVFQATIYVKTRRDARQMYSTIRKAVHEVDRNLPVYDMRTLDEQLDIILTTERMVATLSAVFGVLATVLAAIGLYGLMAFNVARRTREIGVRMALGARSANVTWVVMKEVLALVAAGLSIALPAAWALTRLVTSQLYEIRPNDPATLGGAMLLLAIVAALAGYLPARRAARVDPIQALREE